MGQIVSAAATSHTFGKDDGAESAAERIKAGMAKIGREIARSQPDVIIVVSSDHLNNFNLDAQIPLAIGIADEYTPLGDLGIPRAKSLGSRDFAQKFANYCADVGFDLVPMEDIAPDHGVALPYSLSKGTGSPALVPLYINTVMTPSPSCRRSYALGQALRTYVERERPAGERVAVIGSGGLSHWICLPESGQVNEAWDRHIMDCLVTGNGNLLASLSREQVRRDGGNGGLEIATWAFVGGVCGSNKGIAVYYEPMVSWWTGMGGVLMHA